MEKKEKFEAILGVQNGDRFGTVLSSKKKFGGWTVSMAEERGYKVICIGTVAECQIADKKFQADWLKKHPDWYQNFERSLKRDAEVLARDPALKRLPRASITILSEFAKTHGGVL